MTDALALVASLASLTELKTGSPRFSVPPFPGETPPTTVSLLYAIACSEWKVAFFVSKEKTKTTKEKEKRKN